MTSFLLALVMVVGLCIPASAAEAGPETLELIPVEDVDTSATVTVISNDTSTEEALPPEFVSASPDESSTGAETYAIRDYAAPKEVRIYPIVLRVETAEAFIINNISRSKYWTNGGQFDAYFLSTSQTQAFINQIASSLAANPDTSSYTWTMIGWYVKATILLTAERPKRVEFAPRFPQSGTNYETETLAVNSQSTELHLSQEFYFTQNVDPSAYYFMGFRGDFYSTYTSGSHQGQENGIGFSTGVALNHS